MIAVRPSSVPQFLRSGAFYQSLDLSNDQEIHVPLNTLHGSLSANSKDDIENALQSLRYWGVVDIPYELIDSFLVLPYFNLDIDFIEAYPVLQIIQEMTQAVDPLDRFRIAIFRDSLYLVKYLLSRKYAILDYYCGLAAELGRLSILKFLHSQGGLLTASTCEAAFRTGQIEVLQYLQGLRLLDSFRGAQIVLNVAIPGSNQVSVPNLETIKFAHARGCIIDDQLMNRAAELGNVEVLKYAREKGIMLKASTAGIAAAHDQMEVLEYYFAQGGAGSVLITREASAHGRWDCLHFAHMHGCQVDRTCAIRAAKSNQLECLQYLRQVGCPLGRDTTFAAADGGALVCLKFLIEDGCEVDYKALAVARVRGKKSLILYLESLGLKLP